MPLTPNNREEHWLQGMVDGSTDLTPNKRREYWYKEIVDAIGSGGGGGGGGGVLVVSTDMQTMTLDKTWNEISSASFAVLQVLDENIVEYCPIVRTGYGGNNYYVEFASISQDGTTIIQFNTNSADGYPVMDMG